MEIVRTLSEKNGCAVLKVKVNFNRQEMHTIKQYKLYRYRIKTRDGAFIGRDILSINIQGAYRSHLARIKDRWSTALVRTTGFVFLDILLLIIDILKKGVKSVFKLLLGRRKRLSSAIEGITVVSKRIEKIKEADFFIFVSLAAVYKALDYAQSLERTDTFIDDELMKELEGLDFAGAGSQIEDEFEVLGRYEAIADDELIAKIPRDACASCGMARSQ